MLTLSSSAPAPIPRDGFIIQTWILQEKAHHHGHCDCYDVSACPLGRPSVSFAVPEMALPFAWVLSCSAVTACLLPKRWGRAEPWHHGTPGQWQLRWWWWRLQQHRWWFILAARYSAHLFICTNSFNPHNKTMRQILSQFYRWGNWSMKWWSNSSHDG